MIVMMVRTPKELGMALKNNDDKIVIEGGFKDETYKIMVAGKVAWLVAIGAITVAVTAILAAPVTAGTSIATEALVVPAAVSVLGLPATIAAISIATAGGGVIALNKLRKYKIIENNSNSLVLKIR
jgi:hypothetical protein